MTLKYRELKRRYDLDGADQTVKHLSEALREGHLKPEDFSIRDLAEALVPDGREWVRLLDPRSAGLRAGGNGHAGRPRRCPIASYLPDRRGRPRPRPRGDRSA